MQKAKESGAEKITCINLVLGELSGMVDECVQQYFDILKQGTIADGAILAFKKNPLLLKCRKCGKGFTPADYRWDCPTCSETDAEIVSGRDCYLESIEVE